MKTQDLALSVMLHAGLLAGAVCGVYVFGNGPEEDVPAEPFFFEVLEESAIEPSPGTVDSDTAAHPPETLKSPDPPPPDVVTGPVETEAAERPVVSETYDGTGEFESGRSPDLLPEPECEPQEEPSSEPEPAPEPAVEPALKPEPVASTAPSVPENAPPADVENAELVSTPEAAGRIVPRYPRSARRRGREGSVTVEVSVSDSGKVIGAEVVVSSGYGDLDAAAVSAVRSARFHPAVENGVSVTGMLRLTFEFKLR